MYIGYSRSQRSQEAIDSFEVPMSLITKDVIADFISSGDFTNKEKEVLSSLTVSFWKFAAKRNGAKSWHHTSMMYNKTNHYSLSDVADYIFSMGVESIADEMKKENDLKKTEINQKKANGTFDFEKLQKKYAKIANACKQNPYFIDNKMLSNYSNEEIEDRIFLLASLKEKFENEKNPKYKTIKGYVSNELKSLSK